MDKLKAKKTEFCRVQLKKAAASLGAKDAAFVVDFVDPERWLGKHWFSGFKARNSMLFTSPAVDYLFSRSRSCMTGLDPDVVKSSKKSMHVWLTDKTLRQQQTKSKILLELGYRQQVSLALPLPDHNGLSARFSLFFDTEVAMSNLFGLETLGQPMDEIRMISEYISSQRILASPLEDYQLFKPATVSVIRQLAEGGSRRELSERHCMSGRGVDYHIEKAKFALGAKNTTELVHLSNKMLLI